MRSLMLPSLLALSLATACDTQGSASGDTSGGGVNIDVASGDPAVGADIYASSCASCHGAKAQGGSGPNLQGISDSNRVVDTILYGTSGMPGFDGSLSDADISDLLAWLGGL